MVLGMFARYPQPGRTKTRLAKTVGEDAAAELYAAFVSDLMKRLSVRGEQYVVCATPDDAVTREWFLSRLKETDQLWFQPEGDLGERIEAFFEWAGPESSRPVILVGSDSPDLPEKLIADSFAALRSSDVVIVPSTDGGFVLVGLSRPAGSLFRDVRWSTNQTLNDLLVRCKQLGYSVSKTESWYDVDELDDLVALKSRQSEENGAAAPCPQTVAVIRDLERHAEEF